MSTQPKTIDDIKRTKVLLDKTERIPGRDDVGDFKITFQNLQDSLTAKVEIGTIIMYAKSTAPANYLICNGAAISRTTYASLFAVIGTVYGVGDGSTTFNLPDYRAVVPKGVGTQTINARSKSAPAFAAVQEDQIQKFALRIRGVVKGTSAGASYIVGTGDSQVGTVSAATDNATNLITYTFEEYDSGGTPRIGTTTRENSIGTNFCIKYA